jgi:putative transposase
MNSYQTEGAFPRRRPLRLSSYDYSWQGAYFITICTNGRQNIFGEIVDDSMVLNQLGEIAETCWKEIPSHYREVENGVFIIMPNHLHGIIAIEGPGRAGSKPAPTGKYPLSEIVRGFKTYSARNINRQRESGGKHVWQRGFYEHVIRDETEYHQIGDYILFNAAKWESDKENPSRNSNSPLLPFEH